jgi:ribonuclease HII
LPRGPVIGPLVAAAFAIEESREPELKKMGVKDSKLLPEATREKLYKILVKEEHVIVERSAAEITTAMEKRVSLNELEAQMMAEALTRLCGARHFKKVYIDSPDAVPGKFERRLRKYYDHHQDYTCENKADVKYLSVGAASILAKVTRDTRIEEIKREVHYDFGTGYSHDERTIKFLKEHHKDPGLQKYLRHRWETIKRLKTTQIDLGDYL